MAETSAAPLTPALERLVASVRKETREDRDPASTARAVAHHLDEALAEADLLAQCHREASEDDYQQHNLHVEPDGSFSVVSLVWLPGQSTPIHDHVAWCVPGIYRGREEETRYRLVGAGRRDVTANVGASGGENRVDSESIEDPFLVEAGTELNEPGSVVTLAPPGDIHRVRNPGPGKAISLHVYGADLDRLGSSIRRTYDLPVRAGS